MKTLRENDSIHNPVSLSERYPHLKHVIDISHDLDPPYDPKHLGSITYHKMSTVSKIPPTAEEVSVFISIADDILGADSKAKGVIGVHCHYGFNRTGFFICSYLIERLHYSSKEALAAFQAGRPPGIKHAHFINTLVTRYTA